MDAFHRHEEERKREREKQKRQREAEEEAARERARWYNANMGNNSESLDLSDDEAHIFKEVWKSGYRVLSIKWHPDKGGDGEQMVMLNGLKDKLGSMVK